MRRSPRFTVSKGIAVFATATALILGVSTLAPVSSASTASPTDRWSGKWDVEGDSNEDGVFEHFGTFTLELVTDGSLDGLVGPDTPCVESDRKYRGTYQYGGGGTFEACEIAQFGYELYGDYYGNNGLWGQANMAFTAGSPDTWAGHYSPPTDSPHGEQAYLKWRAKRFSETGCEASSSCTYPVIFVPGFLGTEIGCPKSDFFDELWPDAPSPEFYNMRLDVTGTRNHPNGNTCNKNAEPGPVVYRAFGFDVYGGMRKYLRSLEGVKSYFFGYDWRMSPGNATTQARLDKLINRARTESGTKKVTLVAHSMGGLVARWYVGSNPAKVARVVTMGTPYWGAPKPWLALKHGWTEPPTSGPALDDFIPDKELKRFAVNAFGAYFLYPSPAYYQSLGGWLTWSIHGEGPLDMETTLDAVDSARGNRVLYSDALDAHSARLDSYGGGEGIDWQMIVGTGVQTLTGVTETEADPLYAYGNGDGTVPTISAAQGLTTEALVHYVCGIGHAALPGAPEAQQMIRDFVLSGGAIPNPHPGGCPTP
ncbi:MAG TPA: alpha/beta fold hydrolase [Actinomycetota bacterium]|nr:alpha/beta fold hydrolase [Actinomycetota bacterium]